MKLCVMVLAIGDVAYAGDARRVLTHYFESQGIEYHFITKAPEGREVHPSWLKLIAHRILPGYDYIICWDLDLLPRTPNVRVFHSFDTQRLCLAWDWHALCYPNDRFRPTFKYNGGLVGYPVSARPFLESIFDKYAPGTYPSYEQYYLNDEIANTNYDVCELPKDMNVLFSFEEFRRARLQHYTYKHEAKQYIQHHAQKYFATNDWIVQTVAPYTMVTDRRLRANIAAVRHVEEQALVGDVVEVGVWKGGSMLSMILAYDWTNKTERTFHLYDTFEGMTSPSAVDVMAVSNMTVPEKAYACKLSETQEVLYKNSEYPRDKIQFHKGDIRQATFVPDAIAILRLDTDFYDSTRHELRLFYDKVVSGGRVLIDDYGHWKGCKQAVDEWLVDHPEIKIEYSDYTGIFFTKP